MNSVREVRAVSDASHENKEAMSFEERKFAYEMLRREIEYRREKAWRIFSWASTILIGIIGGLVAIYSKSNPIGPELLPCWPHRILVIIAIVILTTYAWFWIRRNQNVQASVSQEIKTYGIVSNVGEESENYPKPWFGYRVTLISLAVAAIAAVWLIPSPCLAWIYARVAA